MDIPGYKWDSEKKRYFKILKTGQLPNVHYTISALADQERQERRNVAFERAELANNVTTDGIKKQDLKILPQNTFEFKKLGKSPAKAYMGSPDELVSSICITGQGKLATGSRNGMISFGGRKSSHGRSIVSLHESEEVLFAAAVDDKFGSIVASNEHFVHLPGQFVNCLQKRKDELLIGTSACLQLWHPSTGDRTSLFCHPVTALSSHTHSTSILGTSKGKLLVYDGLSRSPQHIASMENKRAITNVGSLNDLYSVVACGLEDEMKLFDLRRSDLPIIEFAQYKNWSTLKHGFALNEAKTAVCVALDTCELMAWDAYSGMLLGPSLMNIDKAKNIVPPSIAWPSKGLYITVMNSVILLSRLNLGKATTEEEIATQRQVEGIQRIHEFLNATVRFD